MINYDIGMIINKEFYPHVPRKQLSKALKHVLRAHNVPSGAGIRLKITTDEEVRALNKQHRAVDAPTDILSFPAEQFSAETLEEMRAAAALLGEAAQQELAELAEKPYLGDLIIAMPYVQRHAAELGHPLADELVLLVVHGALHLLGYDHDNAENQARMWQKQAELLAGLGITSINVPLFTFGDSNEDADAD
jgi:probable rRNA maturation factor